MMSIQKRYALYVTALVVVVFSPLVKALQIEDITDKTTPVYTDVAVAAAHQYFIGTVFGSINKYLCVIEQTNYEKHANLMQEQAGAVQAYRVNVDELGCQFAIRERPRIVLASQASVDDPMYIKSWALDDPLPVAARLKVIEEATDTNPFGVMEVDAEVLSSSSQPEMLYKYRLESARNSSELLDVKVAMFLDQAIVDNTVSLNQIAQFFGAAITHDGANNSGAGTIVFKYFSPSGDPRLYPEGIPYTFRAINIAYDSAVLRYSQTLDVYFDSQSRYVIDGGDEGDYCIKRGDPWLYVDKWGVYDDQGAQNTAQFAASYTDREGVEHALAVDGMNFTTAPICRSWSDGSPITLAEGEQCSGVSNGISGGPLRDVEPEELDIITKADGEQFFVRRLFQRKVFSQVDASACASLVLPDTQPTPSHLFFTEETLLDFSAPSAGAVLVNAFADRPEEDALYGGQIFLPSADEDGDGVLNYLDAFPNDDTKSLDLDNDGIDDNVDSTDDRAAYDHADIYTPDAVEHISPSQAPPEGQ